MSTVAPWTVLIAAESASLTVRIMALSLRTSVPVRAVRVSAELAVSVAGRWAVVVSTLAPPLR